MRCVAIWEKPEHPSVQKLLSSNDPPLPFYLTVSLGFYQTLHLAIYLIFYLASCLPFFLTFFLALELAF